MVVATKAHSLLAFALLMLCNTSFRRWTSVQDFIVLMHLRGGRCAEDAEQVPLVPSAFR